MAVNKTLNEDIKEFGVLEFRNGRLLPAPYIQSVDDYIHGIYDLHHFIKAQDYKRNRKWYEQNGIKQVLIKLSRKIHTHLESPIYGLSEEQFWNTYHIRKSDLLFNKKKWIEEQARKELGL